MFRSIMPISVRLIGYMTIRFNFFLGVVASVVVVVVGSVVVSTIGSYL